MQDSPPRKPRRGDELELIVQGLDDRGGAHGVTSGHMVRLRHGVPGAHVAVSVRRRRGGRVEAVVERVLDPGPHSVTARCRHFESCGGCSFQDLAYERQLSELGGLLVQQLAPLGDELPIAEVIPCAQPWAYRNKMDFTFGARRWIEAGEPEGVRADFALGLHTPGRFDKVLDVQGCDIQFPEANALLSSVRSLARGAGLTPWNARSHVGLLRHLVLRKGVRTGELLALLVTSEEAAEVIDPLVRELVLRHPELTTCVQGIRTAPSGVAVGERYRVLHGPGVIHERLAGVRFSISPTSFFQTNTLQAEILVEEVRAALRPAGGEVLFDLYCGAGTFALTLAPCVGRVFGFELAPEAVADARRNAIANGVDAVEFTAGDLALTLSPDALAERGLPAPDLCVIDPPRAGVHPAVLRALIALAPPRVAYVSCNARSAARDVEVLLAGGYRVLKVQPIDLFPHTPHLESVLALERADCGRSMAHPDPLD